MPNWCFNRLRVTGCDKDVKAFLKACHVVPPRYADERGEVPKDRVFSFAGIVPVPKDVLDAGYNKAGYNWQIKHWGTKWDVGDVDIFQTPCHADLHFDTAWSPPVPWVEAASRLFPSLTFTLAYYEPGCFFAGRITYVGGEVQDEEEYGDDCDEFWSLAKEEFGVEREEEEDDDEVAVMA